MLLRGRNPEPDAARPSFDAIDAKLSTTPAHNDLGSIAWGTAWRMQGYLLMAEATGDGPEVHTGREELRRRVVPQ